MLSIKNKNLKRTEKNNLLQSARNWLNEDMARSKVSICWIGLRNNWWFIFDANSAAGVVEEIRAKIEKYGFTAADLKLAIRSASGKSA